MKYTHVEEGFAEVLTLKQAAIVLAHGSKKEAANQEISKMLDQIRSRDSEMLYQAAFMSFGEPDIPAVVSDLVSQGVTRIIVMPFFLSTGSHISQDIPQQLEHEKEKHPEVEIILTEHLAGHPALVDVVLDRIREAL